MTYLAIIANPHSTSLQAGYFPSVFYVLALFMFVIFGLWIVCAFIVKFFYVIYILIKIKRGLFSPGAILYTFQMLTFIKDTIYIIFVGVVTYGMTWIISLSLARFGIDMAKYVHIKNVVINLIPNVGVLLIYILICLAFSAVLYGLWLGKRILPMDLAILRRLGILKNITFSS